ncbi:hypothetical protein [Kosmotoga pacifica]|uniref:Lipoprotein n=1 Tax=Kosmotoga pacifica TaxID=1330330 RepID=A0A0G2Z5F4_9BACT|nr:hypothetical protein [Kosmotoga pacifica]AKI96850.1 hypothetical protein IX53_02340 [Kosmotoga pacifica]
MNKVKLLFLIILVAMLLISCVGTKREFSPGNFAGFTLKGFMTVSSRVELGGEVDGLIVDKGVTLRIKLAKGTESLKIYVIKFESATKSTSFWYEWGRYNFGELKTILSAIPAVYGELSGEVTSGYVKAWFKGRWIFIFIGEKGTVKEAVKAFNEYRKELEKSIKS